MSPDTYKLHVIDVSCWLVTLLADYTWQKRHGAQIHAMSSPSEQGVPGGLSNHSCNDR